MATTTTTATVELVRVDEPLGTIADTALHRRAWAASEDDLHRDYGRPSDGAPPIGSAAMRAANPWRGEHSGRLVGERQFLLRPGLSGQSARMRYEATGPLDRAALRRTLDREGVQRRCYSLDGAHDPEAYVLTIRPGGWATFYSERGHEVGRREFETEDEACAHLLDLILRDPTTRTRP